MRIVSVVGARPQFIKLAAMSEAFKGFDIEHLVINTGQHYDKNMASIFFESFSIPTPDFSLNIGSGTHGVQTGAMMSALDPIFADIAPDWVLVYGDTNSTLAGVISASKQNFKVAHLEAGLRSFNRLMPEELNRVITDHASDLLLAPTQRAIENLNTEGLESRSILVGDVMADICMRFKASNKERRLEKQNKYLVATIHRAENTNEVSRLRTIVESLQNLPLQVKLVAHPRLKKYANSYDLNLEEGSVQLLDPTSYPEMIELILGSEGVITDSGGIQKETYLLEKPCTTIRDETEWVETLENGWNVLDPTTSNLEILSMREKPSDPIKNHFGDGDAAKKSIEALLNF